MAMDITSRIIHLGIMVFALSAYLTGDMADDYKKVEYLGFTIHKWLGMAVAFFVLFRIIYGIVGPQKVRILKWLPYTKERLKEAGEALTAALSFKRPSAPAHLAVSGAVKTMGLLLFTWMATTGTVMFFFVEPGSRVGGLLHFVKEVHEVGETLIPVYLVIHIGAAVIHALYGQDFWRKMLFIKKKHSF